MKRFIISVLFVLLFANFASAQTTTVTFTWVYPTALESEITEFRLYYGATSQASVADPVSNDGVNPAPYDNVVVVPDVTARSHQVAVFPGTYYSRVTAYGPVGATPDDSAFSSTESVCLVGIMPPSGAACTVTYITP